MRYNNILFAAAAIVLLAASVSAQTTGMAGAFNRIGFGARGIGMGNALSAVRTGENSSFYNPAALAQLKETYTSVSYSVMTLDRQMNTLAIGMPLDTNAGLGFGILNTGVKNIDGRDNEGLKTGALSVSENKFFLSFAMRVRKLTFGITTNFFYYSLYEKLSSTSLGIDFGAMLPLSSRLTVAVVFKDINAKYRWDTGELYGQSGNTTMDRFPLRKTLGASFLLPEVNGLLSAEYEATNARTSLFRAGMEVTPIEALTLRGGIDEYSTTHSDQAHPSFGFTLRTDVSGWHPAFHYAYMLEPYGLSAIHVLSLSVKL